MSVHVAVVVSCLLLPTVLFAQTCGSDPLFNTGSGADGTVEAIAVQPIDGKVIIGGQFTAYDGTLRKGIARLNTDGSLDTTFDPGAGTTGSSGDVYEVAVQADGRILIGGAFLYYNDTARKNIARLNADGSLDTSFDPGAGPNYAVSTIVPETDGNILIAGAFTDYAGPDRYHVARITESGGLHPSFDPAFAGANGPVETLALAPGGKVLMGGQFTSYGGNPCSRVIRVESDGALDASFNAGGSGTEQDVYSVVVRPDSSILIAGSFSSYNDVGRNGVALLHPDGSLDPAFDPGTGADNVVRTLVLQNDGSILLGGTFQQYDGVECRRFARINADGGLDTDCDASTGTNQPILEIAMQPDGKPLLAGPFTTYNDTLNNRIARLYDLSTSTPDAPLQRPNMVLYPNPTSGAAVGLTLNGIPSGVNHIVVAVYDSFGRLVGQDRFGTTSADRAHTIRFMQRSAPGTYLVHLILDGRISLTEKIVVE